ncbi:MAG: PDZ domain-containing protein, partial [Deltaproteobacteria bacterium]|nr:PDZ domain-containing protein [Deltaproteobacteria bacterium]
DPMVAYGKAAYRAPEQVAGAAVDHRADLFALGIILYELLTGARPFEGPTVALTEATIAQGEPPSPCALNPRIPKALERIVLTALQRDPARRYADAHAMSYALEHFLYHKGYGPTIVTVEEYLRRHLPELYAEEQIVIAGKGEEGTTDLPRPMTTAALPPVRPTGRRQGIPWGLLITIGLGFMMALLGYRFWQYWPRWMAQQARPVTSSPLHESLPAPPMVDAPSEPPRPAKVLVDTTAPLRRETAAFPEPSLFVSKSPQDAQPWIGMITTNLSFVYAYYDQSAEAGVIVAAVHPGSPAEKAGLREGDLVLRVNGEAVAAPGDLDERRWEVDESIALEIQHAEVRRTATLRLRLANAPAEQGGLAELLALYSRRLHADPDNPVTRYLRAITYAQGCMANAVNAIAGDCPPEWARQYLEDAEASARLAPEWTEAQILAAEARSQLGAMEGK